MLFYIGEILALYVGDSKPGNVISNGQGNLATRLSTKSSGFHLGTAVARPRPQPIAGTPPPDPTEKCDAKLMQQTCSFFGLDLVNQPPIQSHNDNK